MIARSQIQYASLKVKARAKRCWASEKKDYIRVVVLKAIRLAGGLILPDKEKRVA